ncbi:BH3-interacting domain death agonist isoform X2 [Sciurus carolinensis]|uniref:BH3-interacting domain death agonist isoform X2 n=1 Tax=Sciurus carolinensis TaxID=30640 RepID=UPI001FB4B1AD|nr:BH3-interacting domain death agonist isoform X2 [Sciurus carolinensis]
MDSEVSNGSGLRDEHITNLLVLDFLQSFSDCKFHQELRTLGQELPFQTCLEVEREDELQTDGNRASIFMERIEADSESQEEVIQNIARHLAQVGDEMDRSIQPGLVNDLVAHFMNVRLSEEDRRNCLATALKAAMQTYPKDMENEKATLIMTMLLAKKVADHTPSLLRDVFHATVNFINQNLFTYVRDLVRNEMD